MEGNKVKSPDVGMGTRAGGVAFKGHIAPIRAFVAMVTRMLIR